MAIQNETRALAGELDLVFGAGGKVIGPFSGASTLLNDGKILTAGWEGNEILLVRHLDNGNIDGAFGEQGIKRIDLFAGPVKQTFLVSQPSGQALVFGSAGELYQEILYVIRILPDGEPDPTFGQGGRVYVNLAGGYDYANALTIQPDGKIILVGHVTRGYDDYEAVFLRLNRTGDLDKNFGNSGMVFAGRLYLRSVIALPDGRLLFSGGEDGSFVFASYLNDGRPDPGFGNGGFVRIEVSSERLAAATAIQRQVDGKIVGIGWARLPSGERTVATRLNPDGSLDRTFNGGVPAKIEFPGYETQGIAIAIQPDHKILVAVGILGSADNANFALTRLLADGAFDVEFGTQGRVMTDMGGVDFTQAVALQPDGKIVVCGWVLVPGRRQGIARYFG